MYENASIDEQDRLCCGNLLEADMVDGRVILRCLRCGKRWECTADKTLRELKSRAPDV